MVDCLVAVAIVGLFFATLSAVCAQSVGVLQAGRDLATVQQYAQHRLEQLRHCKWQQVTDNTYLRNNIFNATPLGSPMGGRLTETLTITAYPTPTGSASQLTRPPAGPAVPVSVNPAIANADLAQVVLTLTWTPRASRLPRSVTTSILLGRY